MDTRKAMALIALTLGFSGAASSQQSDLGLKLVTASLASVEEAFWVCDYRAATGGDADIAACAAVYEALKQRKFGGDFGKLLRWWQENKAARHEELAAMEG
jgi:hypothetical protein